MNKIDSSKLYIKNMAAFIHELTDDIRLKRVDSGKSNILSLGITYKILEPYVVTQEDINSGNVDFMYLSPGDTAYRLPEYIRKLVAEHCAN